MLTAAAAASRPRAARLSTPCTSGAGRIRGSGGQSVSLGAPIGGWDKPDIRAPDGPIALCCAPDPPSRTASSLCARTTTAARARRALAGLACTADTKAVFCARACIVPSAGG